ncbi:hypothetical protein Rhopal_004441-T1 [Rhodotorula paludigena]|uniref:C2H2-type domain-containing protein n=1 Tax=Rhodotorula paludigena TaxID=86838 RepID=A0AAV5GNF7_9BASI|nr:hypothetical protein Rhopal_004441-T1 [Rhodotorula paludigena]
MALHSSSRFSAFLASSRQVLPASTAPPTSSAALSYAQSDSYTHSQPLAPTPAPSHAEQHASADSVSSIPTFRATYGAPGTSAYHDLAPFAAQQHAHYGWSSNAPYQGGYDDEAAQQARSEGSTEGWLAYHAAAADARQYARPSTVAYGAPQEHCEAGLERQDDAAQGLGGDYSFAFDSPEALVPQSYEAAPHYASYDADMSAEYASCQPSLAAPAGAHASPVSPISPIYGVASGPSSGYYAAPQNGPITHQVYKHQPFVFSAPSAPTPFSYPPSSRPAWHWPSSSYSSHLISTVSSSQSYYPPVFPPAFVSHTQAQAAREPEYGFDEMYSPSVDAPGFAAQQAHALVEVDGSTLQDRYRTSSPMSFRSLSPASAAPRGAFFTSGHAFSHGSPLSSNDWSFSSALDAGANSGSSAIAIVKREHESPDLPPEMPLSPVDTLFSAASEEADADDGGGLGAKVQVDAAAVRETSTASTAGGDEGESDGSYRASEHEDEADDDGRMSDADYSPRLPSQYGRTRPAISPVTGKPIKAISKRGWPPKDLARRIYVCEIEGCGKAFGRPSARDTHMRTHDGVKPYGCPVPSCARRFSVFSNLKRHMIIHPTVDFRHVTVHDLPFIRFVPNNSGTTTGSAKDSGGIGGRLEWIDQNSSESTEQA